jgi:hypothetical protein
MVCASCLRPLEHVEATTIGTGEVRVTYRHALPSDEQHCKLIIPIERSAVAPDAVVEVCDFCSGRPVTWEYPCRDFAFESSAGTTHGLADPWCACEPCHTDIEAGDWPSMVERWMDGQENQGVPVRRDEERARRALAEMWEMFQRHRQGPAVPY